ncbi:HAMP domain-containing histidine kinase [Acidicapsa dinghuensis]|uniref:histidine kinase n=1 Tax=Acidicapsa dinghuensis TaxID=2218256 RepID=A0ABW1ECV8_9BACT|nr:HAMP domain-containing histidine kinase [Acidicapsa dinghuensis]
MRLSFRSLRVRLGLLYSVFMMTSMAGLGFFSYWNIDRVIASARQQTMVKREERIVAFVNRWPKNDRSLGLDEKLRQLSIAIAETDTIQVYDLRGNVLYSSPGEEIYKVGWPGGECAQHCYAVVQRGPYTIRTLSHTVTLDGQKVRLSIGGITNEHLETLRAIRDSYLISCPMLLIASVAGGFILSRRALKPLHRITSEARAIGIQDLKHRLPVPKTGDELQLLAETWNELLARLEAAVARLTQFTSDISHDLRTTITVMLTTAEFALRRSRSESYYREVLTTIATECRTTSRLLDDLLAAARADIVQRKIDWQPVDFTEIALEVCEHLRPKAEIRQQSLRSHVCSDAWTRGDISMLRRMLNILLDNAIKYTPEQGTITISVEKADDRLELKVSDSGIGIPPDALARIFDRFYKVDESRNQEDGSSGLGLAIAKWIVEAHAATIQVNSSVNVGTTFTVTLVEYSDAFSSDARAQRAVTI